MSQLNLQRLKKLAKSVEDFFINILIHNFREVIIIISAFGFIVILIIIFLLSFSGKTRETNELEVGLDDMQSTRGKMLEDLLISPDDFLLPEIDDVDVRIEYDDFVTGREFILPDDQLIIDNYDKLLEDTIDNDLKFNFEKRYEKNK